MIYQEFNKVVCKKKKRRRRIEHLLKKIIDEMKWNEMKCVISTKLYVSVFCM